MLWTSVQGTIGVSVIGLAWLVCPVIEAQNRGLFSSIEGAAAQLDSPTPASLDAITLRSPGGDDGLGPAAARPGDCGCGSSVRPFRAKPYLRLAAVVTRCPRRMKS